VAQQGLPGSVHHSLGAVHRTHPTFQLLAKNGGFCTHRDGPLRLRRGSVPFGSRDVLWGSRLTSDHMFLNHIAWHRTLASLQQGGTEPVSTDNGLVRVAQNLGLLTRCGKNRWVLCGLARTSPAGWHRSHHSLLGAVTNVGFCARATALGQHARHFVGFCALAAASQPPAPQPPAPPPTRAAPGSVPRARCTRPCTRRGRCASRP